MQEDAEELVNLFEDALGQQEELVNLFENALGQQEFIGMYKKCAGDMGFEILEVHIEA